MKTRNCTFCGEPMAPGDKECKQCGWDASKVSAPATDPADQRARIFVALGLAAAYGVMFSLINGADLPAMNLPRVNTQASDAPVQAPIEDPAIAIGAVNARDSIATATVVSPSKPITIKVADVRNATVMPRDAIHYEFALPETEQSCKLRGQVKSSGGDVELFLLTDDQFLFWRANPAAIPHSNWEPKRGSENVLDYQLEGAGRYYLIISNSLSSSAHKVVQVKAQVRCAPGPNRAH